MAFGVDRKLVSHVPWGLLALVVMTALVGIYNLASASRLSSSGVWLSQLLYLGVGLGAVAVIALLDYRVVRSAAVPFYLLNIVALIALKFFGHRAKGAESWFVIGPFRLQPAELMKIGMILMMAKYFHDEDRDDHQGYGFLRLAPAVAIAVLPIVLVLVQPDLGTALMMLFTATTVLLFAKPKWTVLLAFVVIVVGSVGVLWNDYVRPQPEPRWTFVRHKLKKHQDARISGWLDPTTDLKGSNYHSMQSKIAVGSGGLGGKGWMEGTQTGLRYLPEQHTDFIFSVYAEEQGFLRSLLLIALYGAILLASLRVALIARERFGAFTAVGVAAMIFWQVFENIGMVTGLLPITGITLPLLSYGGSSMLSVMIGVGLLVSIAMRRQRL
jgi:rod shape determining protein RodA